MTIGSPQFLVAGTALLVGFAASPVMAQTAAPLTAGQEAVQSQWFTGSLEAPSPALSQAGILALEPYAIYTADTGAYSRTGKRQSTSDNLSQILSVTVVKYSITDHLSIEALPAFGHSWNSKGNTTGFGDLPIELEYRINNENSRTGAPSVTVALGTVLPTGQFNGLHQSALALGAGAYSLKEGLLAQSLFDTWGNHAVRVRVYGAAYEPMGQLSLHDISAYGTSLGYHGNALPGFAADFGVGAGWAVTQRWVLAIDVLENYAGGARLTGTNASGTFARTTAVATTSVSIAPAVEYNWSANVGVIAGVEFSAAGHNAASYVAPQIALSMAF